MITLGSRPRPAAICTMRCLGVAPLAPNATMCELMALAPALVPRDDRAVAVALEDRLRQVRAADGGREPQLVAAGHEDAGRVAHQARAVIVVGLRARDRVDRVHLVRAELGEDLAVHLAGQRAQRRGAADHRDARVGAARERDEPGQDRALADLVLGASDDDDVPFGHRLEASPRYM